VSSKFLSRLLLVPVILFLGLELILWIFIRIPLEPLKQIDLSNELPGLKRDVRLEFDENLTRYLYAPGSKPPGRLRILCLGGSGTFAMLQNASDTWWGQLGSQLEAKGIPVEVAAWGQDRTGIVASTPVAAVIMEDWKPDVVIGNFGFDDVVGQPVEYQYLPEKGRNMAGPARPAGWKQAILRISQTARFFRWSARRTEAGQIQNNIGRTDYWKDTFAKMKKQVNEMTAQQLPPRDPAKDPMQEYLDGWKILQDLCSRHGASLIMTGEASLHGANASYSLEESLLALVPLKNDTSQQARVVRPEPAWVEHEMSRYATAASDLAASSKLPWVNLNGMVPRETKYFFSDVILTDAGAARLAQALLPTVEPVLQARKK